MKCAICCQTLRGLSVLPFFSGSPIILPVKSLEVSMAPGGPPYGVHITAGSLIRLHRSRRPLPTFICPSFPTIAPNFSPLRKSRCVLTPSTISRKTTRRYPRADYKNSCNTTFPSCLTAGRKNSLPKQTSFAIVG